MSPTVKPRWNSFRFRQPDSSSSKQTKNEEYDRHSRSNTANGLIATLGAIIAVAIVVGIGLHFLRKRRLRQLHDLRRLGNGFTSVNQQPDESSTESKQRTPTAGRDTTCDNDIFRAPPPYETAIATEAEMNCTQCDALSSTQQDKDADSLPDYEAAVLQLAQTAEQFPGMAVMQGETNRIRTQTEQQEEASNFPKPAVETV